MPLIYRRVQGYSGSYSNINTHSIESLQCRKIDLYRCIITVGNPSFLTLNDIRQNGLARSLYESILKKIGIVASNIKSDKTGIRRHPVFDKHISDEKRIVSYNLGMAFAKFYSEKILDIPNLIHLEYLKKNNAITFKPQNKRSKEPDLIGQTKDGDWHIFEAKGVSTAESQLKQKIKEAKSQIAQISLIQDKNPKTGSACATYIGSERIMTYLEDPPSDGSKDIEIDDNKFIEAYYSPFLNLKDLTLKKESIDGLDVLFYTLRSENVNLSLGIPQELYELIMSKRCNHITEVTKKSTEILNNFEEENDYSIGLDGFIIKCSEY